MQLLQISEMVKDGCLYLSDVEDYAVHLGAVSMGIKYQQSSGAWWHRDDNSRSPYWYHFFDADGREVCSFYPKMSGFPQVNFGVSVYSPPREWDEFNKSKLKFQKLDV